jgi:hypothetical protein
MAHCRKNFQGIYLILFVLLLAACQRAAVSPGLPAKNSLPAATLPPVLGQAETTAPAAAKALPPLRASSTPLPSPTAIPSFTPFPTATFAPTRTETPGPTQPVTATPFLPLVEGRPFLVYFQVIDGRPSIVLVNADAAGKRVLPLPVGSQAPRLPEALSPNGEWLAFHTGTAGDMYGTVPPGGKYTLALNLMHLPDGKVTQVTPLLSADYPAGLKTVAQQVFASEIQGGSTLNQIHVRIWDLFLRGITSLVWSPNGRQLAFAGQMQGPSSDIYLYNLDNQAIRRITDGIEQVQWMLWSPDGNYILHSSANRVCEGDCDTKYVLDVNSGKTWTPSKLVSEGGVAQVFDWAGPHALAFYTRANGPGQGYLKRIDLSTDQATDLYPNSFQGFVIDPLNNLVALQLNYDITAGKTLEPGIYLYHPDSGKRDLVAPVTKYGQLGVAYWGQGLYRFILWSQDKVYGLAADGSVTQLAEGKYSGLAPNRKWFVIKGQFEDSPALLLLNEKGETVHKTSADRAGSLIWNPNSSGVFALSDQGLHYLNWATGRWTLVDATLTPQSWSWTNVWPYAWKK